MEKAQTVEPLVPDTYEPPALVEVGGFAELTMGACSRTSEGSGLYRFDC